MFLRENQRKLLEILWAWRDMFILLLLMIQNMLLKRKYLKLRGEDTMVTIIAISMIGLLLTSFIGQAVLQSSNSELQRLKQKIETQEELNAGIQMKINELASLDNALEVADTFGLEYNNNNIRVITD